MLSIRVALIAGVLIAAGARAVTPAQSPSTGCHLWRYRIVALPLSPNAINERGEVAGTTHQHRAAVWAPRVGLRELPLPAGSVHSEAIAINNRGHVLAIGLDAAFTHPEPYVVTGHAVSLVPGVASRVHHLSDSGTVSGEAQLVGRDATQPVFWTRAGMQTIDTCCGGSVIHVDTAGAATGILYDDHGRYQAFRWTGSTGIERIGPADRFSAVVAANDRGMVVIDTFPGTQLYRDGRLEPLKLAPRYPSHPHAINDCGVIVGSFGPFSDADRAFGWDEAGGFQDLNELISADSGWKLEAARSINNRGEIVGRGDKDGADDSGFLLIPVTPSP